MEIFENVANLVASKLKAGTIVETKGYTTAGDGGGAKYLIQTSGDYGSTPDGYSDHALANTNVAVLQGGMKADEGKVLVYDMHFSALKGVGFTTGESGGVLSLTAASSQSVGDYALTVSDSSSIVVGQLITHLDSKGERYLYPVVAKSGNDLTLGVAVEAAIGVGDVIQNSYDDDAHLNTQGMKAIVDYIFRDELIGGDVLHIWKPEHHYTSTNLTVSGTSFDGYKNPYAKYGVALKADYAGTGQAFIETGQTTHNGNTVCVHVTINAGWNAQGSCNIALVEEYKGAKYTVVSSSVTTNQSLVKKSLFYKPRQGSKLSVRVFAVEGTANSFVLGQVTFIEVKQRMKADNMNRPPSKHVVFGDSWAARGHIVSRLRDKMKNSKVVNLGNGGDRVPQLLARIGDVVNENPDYIWVVVGTNDYYSGGASGYTLDEFNLSIGQLIGELSKTGATVIMLTPSVGYVDYVTNNKLELSREYANLTEYLPYTAKPSGGVNFSNATPTYLNSWGDGGTPAGYQTEPSKVSLYGEVTGGTSGTQVVRLSSAFTVPRTQRKIVPTDTGFAYVTLDTSRYFVISFTDSPTVVYLDGISFDVSLK